MLRRLPFLVAVMAVACARAPGERSSGSSGGAIVKSTSCKAGALTYLGFRGTGQPPPALLEEILKRFPEARVIEVGEGKLGVVIEEAHSWDVRSRHEAAAAAVGWKGDVVDFPHVERDCTATFHTPMPPPR
jgi:hypothetical protein